MGAGAAVQVTGPVRSVTFDGCDFIGHIATDGGAGARWHALCLLALDCCAIPLPPVRSRAGLCPRPPAPPVAAVNILGASNIRFTSCQLGVNIADNMGGAGAPPASLRTSSSLPAAQPSACRWPPSRLRSQL